MSVAKMLASAFSECPQLPPRPRLRNSEGAARSRQRKSFMDEHCHIARAADWQSLVLFEERALTIKYVESHHPFIKGRVAKIIGESQKDNLLLFPRRMVENQTKNDFVRCHSLHSQPREAISVEGQPKTKIPQRDDGLSMGQLAIGKVFTSKSCKLTPQALPQRSGRPSTRPKTCHALSKNSIQRSTSGGRRIRTASSPNRPYGCSNNSFVGWEQNAFDQEQFLH